MPDHTTLALPIALAYFDAWTRNDFDRAMTFIAADIVCEGPAGPLTGAAAFRSFMEPFSHLVTGADLLGAFGDGDTALLMYDTRTVPVAHAPGAELITVREHISPASSDPGHISPAPGPGLITRIRIIFDRLPFAEARQRATPQ